MELNSTHGECDMVILARDKADISDVNLRPRLTRLDRRFLAAFDYRKNGAAQVGYC